jgi:5-methylcytosine-specific restriction protein A
MPSRIPRRRGPTNIPKARRPPPPQAEEARRAYDATAERKADKAFYKSPKWRAMREAILADNPLCVDCLAKGRTTPAAHVHHVEERKDRPELALARSNLAPLCQPCHNRHRRARLDRERTP